MVFLMMSEHYATPGLVVRICATRERAVREALACVNVMLTDSGLKSVIDETDMRVAIDYLQDIHGAAHCYAEISEHEVMP
jgi:hypothetical protein